MRSWKPRDRKLWRRKEGRWWVYTVLNLLLITMTLLATACVAYPYDPRDPTESPLIPGTNARLIDNTWWLSKVTHQGETIAFDAISPLWVQFAVSGQLVVSEARCNVGGYQIVAANENHYRLFSGSFTEIGCSDRATEQSIHLQEALLATTSYELRDSQLFLLGEETQIILVDILPENPLTIGAGTDLLEKSWRLAKVTHQGKVIDAGPMQPLYFGFASDGYLTIASSTCYVGSYEVIPETARQYDITAEYYSSDPCVDAQMRQVVEMLDQTTAFEIKDGQLFLIGDDVQIVLEIDNAP